MITALDIRKRPGLGGKLTKTAVALPSAFLMAVAVGLLQLGMIFYLREVKLLSPASIGLFAAFWWLSYSAACLLMRPVAARLMPRLSIILSTALVGAFVLIMFSTERILLTYLFYALAGVAMSLFWPPLMGWLSYGLEGPALNLAISRFNLSWSLGMVVSPFITGLLSERSPELPIYTAAGIFFGISLLVLTASLTLPVIRCDRFREPRTGRRETAPELGTPLRYPAWAGLLTTYFVLGVIFNVFPLFATERLEISKSLVGVILLFRALAAAGAFVVLGRISFWHDRPVYMLGTQGAIALVVLGLLVSGRLAAIVPLLALIGALSSSSYVASILYGVSGSSRRSTRMAVNESLLALGVICGSICGGMLYQNVGMTSVYGLSIGLLAAGLGVQLVLLRGRRGVSARAVASGKTPQSERGGNR